jgi:hypothetical protein
MVGLRGQRSVSQWCGNQHCAPPPTRAHRRWRQRSRKASMDFNPAVFDIWVARA